MKLAFFPGCKIPSVLPEYGLATRAVLRRLDVELIEPEFNCCGYTQRHLHFDAFLLMAGRNLALAEARGLDILTPCKCCYGSLRHAAHFLRSHPIATVINRQLRAEGLCWTGKIEVKHLLPLLARDLGYEAVARCVTTPHKGLRVAAHYGCHALRPSDVMQFDNPLAPTIFERLVELTGASAVDWPRRLDCCGQPLLESNEHLSLRLMQTKVADARQAGADTLCTACTYCQVQFGQVQRSLGAALIPQPLPSVLFPQLLGLSMGLEPEELGLSDALRKPPERGRFG